MVDLIVQAPTNLRTDVLDSLERLSPASNTSLGQGIFTALNAIAREPLTLEEEAIDLQSGLIDLEQLELNDYWCAVILLLTDGETEPLAIVQIAAEAGSVYTQLVLAVKRVQ